MTSVVSLLVFACACVWSIWLMRRKNMPHPCFVLLTAALPFAAGGFHGYTLGAASVMLAVFLLLRLRREKILVLHCSLSFAAVLTVFLASCLTPLWAADRGMAPFGILRWIPVLLYTLFFVQCSRDEQDCTLTLVPLAGGVMTVVSAGFALIPGLAPYVTVNGRLAGFFQYPNTFAAFLLAGLVIHFFSPGKKKGSPVITVILLSGIVLSGSRTVFVLLAAVLGAILSLKKGKGWQELAAGLAAALALGLFLSGAGILSNADRYTGVSLSAGTFLVRLLYFKDALKLIAAHPFGLGYLGFRAVEGSIQTGRYYVTYIHNGFLQLLLDYGWIPGLVMAAAFIKSLFSRENSPEKKLLLILLLAHCMLDYDTEFLSVWILLLPLMDFSGGKTISISFSRWMVALAACLMAVSLWLGSAELCYYMGSVDACLKLAPFHTDALTYRMSRAEDPADMEALADRILDNNPYYSLAWTAKSNAAFLRGEVAQMAAYKLEAIRCNRYDIAEYCDYLDKLYAAIQITLQMGDTSAAGFCAGKMMEVPDLMAEVSRGTDPLAYRTGDDPSLILPEEYRQLIATVAAHFA